MDSSSHRRTAGQDEPVPEADITRRRVERLWRESETVMCSTLLSPASISGCFFVSSAFSDVLNAPLHVIQLNDVGQIEVIELPNLTAYMPAVSDL